MILGLCDRFGQLPSAVRAESAEVLRLIRIQDLGTRKEAPPGG